MKQYRGFIWVAIIIVALIAIKVLFLKSTTGPATGGAKGQQVQAVNAVVIKPQVMNNVAILSGSLQANESVNLQPQVGGMITALSFKEGDFVHKGDLLVKINDADLKAQLQKEEAALDVAQSNMDRVEKLYKLNSVSEDDYNNATLAVKTAKADIAYTQAQIDNTEIHAPFDGVVGVRFVSPGAYVSPSTVIATLYSYNPIKIEFDIPEKFASQVKVGSPLTFTVQGNPKTYNAKVYVVNPGINADTRTLTMRAICDNDGSLRPGSFADISLDLGSDPHALLVPTQALVPVMNGQVVYVAHHDSAFSVPVQIGIRNDTAIQITSGIKAGDTVITSGILFMRPKAKVQLKKVK